MLNETRLFERNENRKSAHGSNNDISRKSFWVFLVNFEQILDRQLTLNKLLLTRKIAVFKILQIS